MKNITLHQNIQSLIHLPRSQSVLLSLIQQLSVDQGEKTEVKHAYLHEALVNLEPKN